MDPSVCIFFLNTIYLCAKKKILLSGVAGNGMNTKRIGKRGENIYNGFSKWVIFPSLGGSTNFTNFFADIFHDKFEGLIESWK